MNADSDEHLVRYLLGELPDEEAERLDERSITDDALALRLRELENDLADRYARGGRLDASLARFDRAHRQSLHLQDKVRFAEALHTLTSATNTRPGAAPAASSPGRFAWWMLAAATVLLLVVPAYWLVREQRLRDQLAQADAQRASIDAQNTELRRQLEQARAAAAKPPSPVIATFVLAPPRRGAGDGTANVTLRPDTTQVILRLQIEADGHRTFWVAVRDVATRQIVWRSPDVPAEADAGKRVVTVAVPASVLANQRYSADLSGIAPDGSSELIGNYPIRVVLE